MFSVCACGAADGTSSVAGMLPGTEQHTIMSGAAHRTYLLHVGAGLRPGGSHPQLVVVLHGATLSAAQTEHYYHWDDLADAQGFAVAYPQGIHDAWNAGSCCADAPTRQTDDVGFIAAVMADATWRTGADRSRVYRDPCAGVEREGVAECRVEVASDEEIDYDAPVLFEQG
jgi:polyhydroxybutyrate depolymerase